MFIDRLLNDGNAPLLEQMLRFTDARHRLLAEDVVNANTPGYRNKDLSTEQFQALLRERVAQRESSPPGSVRFDDIMGEVTSPARNILFHDGNNRSVEQLMADSAKNALLHNLAVELLRKQFAAMEMALKERVT
jgi:flagellar basal-body rod protein FlgB